MFPKTFIVSKRKDLLLPEVLFCCQLRTAVGVEVSVDLHQRKTACFDIWTVYFTALRVVKASVTKSLGEPEPCASGWSPVSLCSTWPKITPALSHLPGRRRGSALLTLPSRKHKPSDSQAQKRRDD